MRDVPTFWSFHHKLTGPEDQESGTGQDHSDRDEFRLGELLVQKELGPEQSPDGSH
jgi:hypothetical protein